MAPAATGTEWAGTAGDCGVTGDDDDGGGGHTRGAGGGGDGEHPNGGAGGGGGDGGCTGMGDGEVDDDADNADVIIDGGRVESDRYSGGDLNAGRALGGDRKDGVQREGRTGARGTFPLERARARRRSLR